MRHCKIQKIQKKDYSFWGLISDKNKKAEMACKTKKIASHFLFLRACFYKKYKNSKFYKKIP